MSSSESTVDDTFPSKNAISQFAMSRADRVAARNVQIYDAKELDSTLGGFYLTQDVTNSGFYAMLDVFIVPSATTPFQENFGYVLQKEDGTNVQRDSNFFRPGSYYLSSAGSVTVSSEVPLTRTTSLATGSRVKAFSNAVRSRDDRCIISGRLVRRVNDVSFYRGFEAAHVFPLAYEGHWQSQNFGRWITQESEKGGTINSVQNGLLLSSEVHQLFDAYSLSINPDDNYNVICFHPDAADFAGRAVSRDFLDNTLRPPDQLLRWHFRQAVLTNMKGAGEPTFEHDLPPGCDIMREIQNGPKAVERMEFEIFGRLATHIEIV